LPQAQPRISLRSIRATDRDLPPGPHRCDLDHLSLADEVAELAA
jgi:hypothetical protein